MVEFTVIVLTRNVGMLSMEITATTQLAAENAARVAAESEHGAVVIRALAQPL